MTYWRPIVMSDPAMPETALPLAGGPLWFDRVEMWERGGPRSLLPACDLPPEMRARLTEPRAPVWGLTLDHPVVMGILNVTPDSFSDGGRHDAPDAALNHARSMIAAGAGVIDIGGESTRPGAPEVPAREEIARTEPVIAALSAGTAVPLSIDTRKAVVARVAVAAGAALVNDVTGLDFDPGMAAAVAETGAALCLMHSRGTPETMNNLTLYDDVLADVYDWLEAAVARAEGAGIPRSRIVVDPGIGFAKTAEQNIALLRGLSLFHGLGCGLLLGVSRKRFIGTIGGASEPRQRMPGSIAVALAGAGQGAQILRVHDVAETVQALRLWRAMTGRGWETEE
ncbi:dihydropteroate synthase [Haematobacter massiliensis]|uniref:Dihydropteroate synthase n=1 Tax=Haematobacter massiliensis TaxID=195105 RepID=A0A086XYK3_9RHOB|nr:dihydropteroate synthase [Haematobacter massiliensis]KFI27103.1 dihydropteroate synthase [Haematobacter massiliensis]OWJ73772.1 dihydropteroate synthase [Haematobacter massiliensis]OWJ82468.1 dihydropteroate synthase [Haematobacter massiliensis]QBJ23615.1 dihydropteroate synthase [Haematobacter massiliensis]